MWRPSCAAHAWDCAALRACSACGACTAACTSGTSYLPLLCTLQAILGNIAQLITSQVRAHAVAADLDGDGEITLEDSKLGMSRMAPYVKRHPGLTGGFAGGFLLAYRLV